MPAAVKKPAATSAKKESKKTNHPTYQHMIQEAVATLNERKGVSREAIIKYISKKYDVGSNVNMLVRKAIGKMSDKKELVRTSTKTTGAIGKFKLPGSQSERSGQRGRPKKIVDDIAAQSPVKRSPSPKKVSPKKAPLSPKKPVAKKAKK